MESFVQWMTSVLAFRLGVSADNLDVGSHVHLWSNPFGAASRVAPSTDEESRRRNRRVEITVSASNVEVATLNNGKSEII
jgi:hypothetical protein